MYLRIYVPLSAYLSLIFLLLSLTQTTPKKGRVWHELTGGYKSRLENSFEHNCTTTLQDYDHSEKEIQTERKMEDAGVVKGCCAFLCILLAVHSAQAVCTSECSTLQFCTTQLNASINRLCSTTASPGVNPVEWESISLTQIGVINMGSTVTQSFVIPTSIPTTANEVLVYVYTILGNSVERFSTMKIYTELSNTRQFHKYLPVKTYDQSAYSTTAENMWFPLTSNRRIYISLSTALTGNVYGYVNMIGYR